MNFRFSFRGKLFFRSEICLETPSCWKTLPEITVSITENYGKIRKSNWKLYPVQGLRVLVWSGSVIPGPSRQLTVCMRGVLGICSDKRSSGSPKVIYRNSGSRLFIFYPRLFFYCKYCLAYFSIIYWIIYSYISFLYTIYVYSIVFRLNHYVSIFRYKKKVFNEATIRHVKFEILSEVQCLN